MRRIRASIIALYIVLRQRMLTAYKQLVRKNNIIAVIFYGSFMRPCRRSVFIMGEMNLTRVYVC